MRRLVTLVAGLALAGCGASLGTAGVLLPDADGVGVKLLHPGVSGRSCRASIVGIPLADGDPSLREATARVLALDAEGNALTDAEVRWEHLVTGLYNRRCIEVRGNLVRTISSVTIPMGGHAPH
jgi:hypothetical protein